MAEEGLLGFLNTPAGMGLLSGIATYATNARRGTPVNNIGRGLAGGLMGYGQAQDQVKQDQERAFDKQFKNYQLIDLQNKIEREKAAREWKAGLPQVMNQAKTRFTPFEAEDPFNQGPEAFGEIYGGPQHGQQTSGAMANIQPGNPQALQDYMMNPESPYADKMMEKQLFPETVVVGRTLKKKDTGETLGYDETWKEEQAASRAQRIDELTMRLQDQQLSREQNAALRRDLAAQSSADRMTIAGMVNATRQQKNTPKLPTSALKLQQEELDAIGTAATIQSDLGAIKAQVDGGQLKLGPVNNLLSAGKNWAGASDENSRNYGTFKATLEKLRNDSLRLNKGVQTEGDSKRAWNELVTNMNDPEMVSKRLSEIQAINERAANIRRMNVESIRTNFGLEPMDTTEYENQPAAVGKPPAGTKPPQKAAPKPGEVRNGYKYFGGDPANPKSWVKVKQ